MLRTNYSQIDAVENKIYVSTLEMDRDKDHENRITNRTKNGRRKIYPNKNSISLKFDISLVQSSIRT